MLGDLKSGERMVGDCIPGDWMLEDLKSGDLLLGDWMLEDLKFGERMPGDLRSGDLDAWGLKARGPYAWGLASGPWTRVTACLGTGLGSLCLRKLPVGLGEGA